MCSRQSLDKSWCSWEKPIEFCESNFMICDGNMGSCVGWIISRVNLLWFTTCFKTCFRNNGGFSAVLKVRLFPNQYEKISLL